MVGFAEVLQQTPRAVTGAPPSALMLPPLCAVVSVMEVIAVVINVGKIGATPTSSGSFLQLEKITVEITKRMGKNNFLIMIFGVNNFLPQICFVMQVKPITQLSEGVR